MTEVSLKFTVLTGCGGIEGFSRRYYRSMGSHALDDAWIMHLYEYITSFPEALFPGLQLPILRVAPMYTHTSKESVPQCEHTDSRHLPV